MFRGILTGLGLINFGFGILALAQPQLVAGWIGFELQGPAAFGEMRAVFGGAAMVVGVLFIVAGALAQPRPLLGGLALVFAALSLGRLASLVIDGWSFYTAAAFVFEAASAGVTVYLWSNPQALMEPTPESPGDAYE